jgi:hypothetical protein
MFTFTLGEFRISDDLSINIGDRAVQLRPAQGLRVVEALLRASTRRMMAEEAERAPKETPSSRRSALPRSTVGRG